MKIHIKENAPLPPFERAKYVSLDLVINEMYLFSRQIMGSRGHQMIKKPYKLCLREGRRPLSWFNSPASGEGYMSIFGIFQKFMVLKMK